MIEKLASRKFWMAAAAFLASIGGTITGLATGNDTLTVVGVVCTALSSAIYAACEAYVDGQSAASNKNVVTTNVTASTTAKDTVERMLTNNATPATISAAEKKEETK